MTILVVGDANADLSATLATFPREGQDTLVTALQWGSGGSAANVAAALALLGAPVRLLTRVGRDAAAATALRVARDAGVDLDAVQRDDTLATGLCYAAISADGERTLFSFRGANAAFELGPGDQPLLQNAAWLHIAGHALLEGQQRESVEWLRAAAASRVPRCPVSIDLCLPLVQQQHERILALLSVVDIVFANEMELAALLPDRSPESALDEVARATLRMAALKCGSRGCIVVGSGVRHTQPAFPVAAIDTTGCGDAFVAGFLYAHLREAPPEACATLANALGALAATRAGAADSLPDRTQVGLFLAEDPIVALVAAAS